MSFNIKIRKHWSNFFEIFRLSAFWCKEVLINDILIHSSPSKSLKRSIGTLLEQIKLAVTRKLIFDIEKNQYHEHFSQILDYQNFEAKLKATNCEISSPPV